MVIEIHGRAREFLEKGNGGEAWGGWSRMVL